MPSFWGTVACKWLAEPIVPVPFLLSCLKAASVADCAEPVPYDAGPLGKLTTLHELQLCWGEKGDKETVAQPLQSHLHAPTGMSTGERVSGVQRHNSG